MTTVVLACLALAAPQQASPHRQFLDKLASAKFLSFQVVRTTNLVALPEEGVQRKDLVGKMTVAKDGRWLWEREDGWALLFDGNEAFKTAVGSGWYEESPALDMQGVEITKDHLRHLLLGLDPFFFGKWKGVAGQQDWWGSGYKQTSEDEPRTLSLVRPLTASKVQAAKEGDLTAGIWLEVDEKTLAPRHAEWWSENSYDREEWHAAYSNFVFDPPGADALLTKRGDRR